MQMRKSCSLRQVVLLITVLLCNCSFIYLYTVLPTRPFLFQRFFLWLVLFLSSSLPVHPCCTFASVSNVHHAKISTAHQLSLGR